MRWATTLELIDRGTTAVVPDLVARRRPHVSIDLDVPDLSLPGGLSYRQL